MPLLQSGRQLPSPWSKRSHTARRPGPKLPRSGSPFLWGVLKPGHNRYPLPSSRSTTSCPNTSCLFVAAPPLAGASYTWKGAATLSVRSPSKSRRGSSGPGQRSIKVSYRADIMSRPMAMQLLSSSLNLFNGNHQRKV